MPAGHYQVQCAVVLADCVFKNDSDSITIAVPDTTDLDVVVTDSSVTSVKPRDLFDPTPPTDSAAPVQPRLRPNVRPKGSEVCGQVTFQGKPRRTPRSNSNVSSQCNYHVSVNTNGYYGLTPGAGYYMAVCIVLEPSADTTALRPVCAPFL